MYEQAIQLVTYYEKQKEIANRLRVLRKKRKISRERLSQISGVSYATIRRFEETGDISFESFVKIALSLRRYEELDALFKDKTKYTSIEEVLKDQED